MGKINLGRVILGGIVAGIIIDIIEYVLNAIVLADRWNAIIAAHNLPQFTTNAIIVFNIIGLVTGIAAVWTYAAIRPRFGEGPSTAVIAALLIWIVSYLLPDVAHAGSGLCGAGGDRNRDTGWRVHLQRIAQDEALGARQTDGAEDIFRLSFASRRGSTWGGEPALSRDVALTFQDFRHRRDKMKTPVKLAAAIIIG